MYRHASTALASFITAAKLGSFAAAGRALGISPAAVGQNIKRLEDGYGVKLFVRTTRQMSLTPEGVLLYQRARGPLQELDEIDASFDESRGVASGVLRLSAPKLYGRRWLAPLIAKFLKLYPQIEIDLDVSDTTRDIGDVPVDLAFRAGHIDEPAMIARTLTELPVLTLGAPHYLDARGTPHHPQDLREHECLRLRSASGALDLWTFAIEGEVQRFDPLGSIVSNDGETLIEMAAQGLGLVQMDTFTAHDFLRDGRLLPVMTQFTPILSNFYMCYASREHMPLRVKVFMEFVEEFAAHNCYSLDKSLSLLPHHKCPHEV